MKDMYHTNNFPDDFLCMKTLFSRLELTKERFSYILYVYLLPFDQSVLQKGIQNVHLFHLYLAKLSVILQLHLGTELLQQ